MAHHPPPAWESVDGLMVARFRHGPLWNFSYLIACEETREAAVIDPAWDVAGILEAAAGKALNIRSVLLTHGHSDHANGVAELTEATGARVLARAGEEELLPPEARGAVFTFESDEHFEVGRLRCLLMHTPGHTPGSASFVIGGRCFSGDTLSVGSPGTPGPEPGAIEALWETTRMLSALPDETAVHPGHDSGPAPRSTLGIEKLTNPGLLAATFEEFVATVERATGRRMRD